MKEILLTEKEMVFLGLLYFYGISESVHAEREGKIIKIKVLKKVIGRSIRGRSKHFIYDWVKPESTAQIHIVGINEKLSEKYLNVLSNIMHWKTLTTYLKARDWSMIFILYLPSLSNTGTIFAFFYSSGNLPPSLQWLKILC